MLVVVQTFNSALNSNQTGIVLRSVTWSPILKLYKIWNIVLISKTIQIDLGRTFLILAHLLYKYIVLWTRKLPEMLQKHKHAQKRLVWASSA